jgi:hypothetical protein
VHQGYVPVRRAGARRSKGGHGSRETMEFQGLRYSSFREIAPTLTSHPARFGYLRRELLAWGKAGEPLTHSRAQVSKRTLARQEKSIDLSPPPKPKQNPPPSGAASPARTTRLPAVPHPPLPDLPRPYRAGSLRKRYRQSLALSLVAFSTLGDCWEVSFCSGPLPYAPPAKIVATHNIVKPNHLIGLSPLDAYIEGHCT